MSTTTASGRRPPPAALVDEYRLSLLPVALSHGKPYFAGPRPALRFVRSEVICQDVVRLSYVPR